MKIAIIKADDVRDPSANWKKFIAVSQAHGVKVSCGVICSSLVKADPAYRDWMRAEEATGLVEFWNHGWDHRQWNEGETRVFEFSGSGQAHQSEHLAKSQSALAEALGRATVAFGAPFNRTDEDTQRVLASDPDLRLVFAYNDSGVEGLVTALMTLKGEPDGTGKPNFAKFVTAYQKHGKELGFSAIQFHPNAFEDGSGLEEYVKTIDFLAAEGWTFMLPREYLAWLRSER